MPGPSRHDCPYCGSRRDEPCRTRTTGRHTMTHAIRWHLYHEWVADYWERNAGKKGT